jgi:hypothetical protein
MSCLRASVARTQVACNLVAGSLALQLPHERHARLWEVVYPACSVAPPTVGLIDAVVGPGRSNEHRRCHTMKPSMA